MHRWYILAGQSNMAGGITTEELPDQLRAWPQQITCVGPDGSYNPLDGQGCGPELGFAIELAERFPEEKQTIVKYARGGTNLANEWSPDGRIRQAEEPEQRQHCFAKLLQAIEQAHKLMPAGAQCQGLAWMQGERDSRWPAMAQQYLPHLSELVDAIRRHSAQSQLKAAIGRITPRKMLPDGSAYAHAKRNLVRQAQEQFCARDDHAILVDADDLPQRADALHFATPGSLVLGKRLAQALL